MKFYSAILIGIHNIFQQKFRSFLTMLGIIFGVGAVISMLSIGRGAEEEIIKKINEYGLKNIIIKSSIIGSEKLKKAKRLYSKGLSLDDLEFLESNCSFIDKTAPEIVLDTTVKYNSKNPKCNIVGVNGNFEKVIGIHLKIGRFIKESDNLENRFVCVLGNKVKKILFVNRNPVGKQIFIGSKRFTVIGFLKSKFEKSITNEESSRLKSRNTNLDVYIPLNTAINRFSKNINTKGYENSLKDPNYNVLSEIIVKIHAPENFSAEYLKKSKFIISKIIKRRHKNIDDFEIIIPLEILEQSKKTQEIFSIVLSLIASLSLLVGGIGIMNIMLANINERTKEIGIRRSIGASKTDIKLQFLIEGILISVAGGIIGIFLGISISYSINYFLKWTTKITFFSITISFLVAFITGILFSYFPASKGANLDPIEALRHD